MDHYWRAAGMDLAVAFKLARTLEVHPGDMSAWTEIGGVLGFAWTPETPETPIIRNEDTLGR